MTYDIPTISRAATLREAPSLLTDQPAPHWAEPWLASETRVSPNLPLQPFVSQESRHNLGAVRNNQLF